MGITTVLFYSLTRTRWGWSTARSLAVCVPFAIMDLGFFSANVFKIPSGGWFPLVVGAGIMLLMTTWRTGRAAVAERLDAELRPVGEFIACLPDDVVRVPGVAAFMYRRAGYAPPALRTNTRHNRALHEMVLLVSVEVDPEAYLEGRRVEVEPLGNGCFQVSIRHGYMEEANVPRSLDGLLVGERRISAKEVTFFLGRETVISTPQPTMSRWRERLFALLLRSAASASRFFDLPSDQVVEVGSQISI
jgi:KUP system potassium uptake protein